MKDDEREWICVSVAVVRMHRFANFLPFVYSFQLLLTFLRSSYKARKILLKDFASNFARKQLAL